MCVLVMVYCHVVHVGAKASRQDDWERKDGSRRQEPQKVDVNRLPTFLRKGGGKDNPREVCFIVVHIQCHSFLLLVQAATLAPSSNLRPSGWNRKPVIPTPPPEQPKQGDKQRSSKVL